MTVAKFCSNSIFHLLMIPPQWAVSQTMMRWEYRKKNPVKLCNGNNLSLDVSKMKEIIIDFTFLGVQITNNLSWSLHADAIAKKAFTFSGG